MQTIPDELIHAIQSANRIGLSAHARPDGDAIGSTVGLAEALMAVGKTVFALNEDGVPPGLAFVDPNNLVVKADGQALEIDLALVLDTSTAKRLGDQVTAAFRNAPVSWAIDHHFSNELFCTQNWVRAEAAATGCMVLHLIDALKYPLPPAARDALFVAISTDTGNFQYPNTTAETLRDAARLVELGASSGDLNQKIQSFPFRRIEALRELLKTLELSRDGRVASWTLTKEVKHSLNLDEGDTEGLTDLLRGIDTVVATVIFDEVEEGLIRISSRSKDPRLSVAAVCAKFGGGGHVLAAGVRMREPLAIAREQFLHMLHEEIERLD